jgi:pimeloyl-ACP methyl ester carboxylesterase
MMMQWFSIVLAAGVLTVFFYYFVKAYKLAYKVSHPRRIQFRLELGENVSQRIFDFKSSDGVKLQGLDIMPEGRIEYTLLICHNLGGSKESALSFYKNLLKNGFSLIAFDFRNHGQSECSPGIRFRFFRDFDAFLRKINTFKIAVPMGIVGLSIGSHVALYGMLQSDKIKAILIDSGPLLYSEKYFRYVLDDYKIKNPLYRFWFICLFLYYGGFRRLSRITIKFLRSIQGKPLFMIYPEKDHIIPPNNVIIAYAHAHSQHSILWMVPNSHHLTNFFLAQDEYQTRVKDFFISNLKNNNDKLEEQLCN